MISWGVPPTTDVHNYATQSGDLAAEEEAVINARHCSGNDEADTGCQAIPDKETLQTKTNLNKLATQTLLSITAPLRFNKNHIMNLDRVQTSLALFPGIHLYPITYSLINSADKYAIFPASGVKITHSPPTPDVLTTNADIWAENGTDVDIAGPREVGTHE